LLLAVTDALGLVHWIYFLPYFRSLLVMSPTISGFLFATQEIVVANEETHTPRIVPQNL